MCALSLACHILFGIKVNSVVIGFNAEDGLIQVDLSSGLFAVYVNYCYFHHFVIIT